MKNYLDCANYMRKLVLDAAVESNTNSFNVSFALTDILTVLLNEYYQYTAICQDWDNQDNIYASNKSESLAIDSFWHLLQKIPIEKITENFKNNYIDCDILSGKDNENKDNKFSCAVGAAFSYHLLQTKYNQNQDDWNMHTNHSFILADFDNLKTATAHGACNFAGTMGINKLIILAYTFNESIDNKVLNIYSLYDWQVIAGVDGSDFSQISQALNSSIANKLQPSLIVFKVNNAITDSVDPKGALIDLYDKFNKYPKPTAINYGDSIYQDWKNSYDFYQQKVQSISQIQNKLTQQINTELATKALSLAEELQETENNMCISDGCLLAIHLLIEPIIGSIVLTYNDTIKQRLLQISDKTTIRNSIIAMQKYDNNRLMGVGIALPLFNSIINISYTTDIADSFPAFIAQNTLENNSISHIFINSDNGSLPSMHTIYKIPRSEIWRPCDKIEAVIALLQATVQNNTTIIIADEMQSQHYARDIDDMDNIVLGGYCLFDSLDSSDKHQASPDIVFMAQGSEVGEVMANMDIMVGNQHSQVWSVPAIKKLFSQRPHYYQALCNAKTIVVCNDVCLELCQPFLPTDKLILVDDWLELDK